LVVDLARRLATLHLLVIENLTILCRRTLFLFLSCLPQAFKPSSFVFAQCSARNVHSTPKFVRPLHLGSSNQIPRQSFRIVRNHFEIWCKALIPELDSMTDAFENKIVTITCMVLCPCQSCPWFGHAPCNIQLYACKSPAHGRL
jgi:hypothetical protein